MRWAGQQIDAEAPDALPGLGSVAGFVRSVTTPEFQGITFHEVIARSALNHVPGSGMPFSWTVNPYRGCTHACRYCFARPSHRYLELDQGRDFDQQIVVKTNVAEVLRREVARPSWRGEQVALGTNTDPYQRAEGRYRLMPGIIEALAGSGTPLSILTKGTLLRRDLQLLQAAAEEVPVGLGVSLALADEELRRRVEPGVPSARGRLELIRSIREAGLPCGVMVAPVLPYLTDSAEQLDHLFGELAEAGATGVTTLVLHLRPGVREWFMGWLAREYPELVTRYEELYRQGKNALPSYRRSFEEKVRPLLAKHGFGRDSRHRSSANPSRPKESGGSSDRPGRPAGDVQERIAADGGVTTAARPRSRTPGRVGESGIRAPGGAEAGIRAAGAESETRAAGPASGSRAEVRHASGIRAAGSESETRAEVRPASGIRATGGVVEASGPGSSSGWGEPDAVGDRFRSGPFPRRSDPAPLRPGESASSRRRRTAPVPPVVPGPEQQPLF